MMNVKIETVVSNWSYVCDETESAVWETVGKTLLQIPVPNHIKVKTDKGDASLEVKKRGTFVKDGIEYPSMYVVCEYNGINLPSCNYPETYLTCVNPESNNYKFYHLIPETSGIMAEYGRIGSKAGEMFGVRRLQTPYESFLYWVRYYEKLSKGYVDSSKIYLTPQKPKKTVKPTSAVSAADSRLYDLVVSYARNVVQQNLVDTTVTVGQVKESKRCLKSLREAKRLSTFNKRLMLLLAVCPRRVRYVDELLADSVSDFADIIDREENLVAAMDAVVTPDASSFASLGIEVYDATKEQKEKVMEKLEDSLKPKVKNVYRVINQSHKKRFNNYLKANHIRHVKELWHGSRNENWFSIMENGLLLKPNAVITGKMFGDGIYFAPSSKKSWGYTSGKGSYWANGNSPKAFMGVYAVAYGKPLDVQSAHRYTQSEVLGQGCNCVHAHAGSHLYNDEIIFYDESAMLLNYIVEFNA